MSETEIDLADYLQRFIRREIMEGRFSSTGEVIEAGLLLLQERETRLAALRTVLEQSDRATTNSHVDTRGQRRA